jgi:hypothetical protein
LAVLLAVQHNKLQKTYTNQILNKLDGERSWHQSVSSVVPTQRSSAVSPLLQMLLDARKSCMMSGIKSFNNPLVFEQGS